MLALASMASGEPVDMQRERRWPQHTPVSVPNVPQNGAGVKVNFESWEEDDDFSDLEGVCGPIDTSQIGNASDEEAA